MARVTSMSKLSRSAWDLDTLPSEVEWRLLAACRSRPPAWWDIPAQDERTDGTDLNNRMAKRLCRSCPVKPDCLDEAVELREIGVIRAGHELPSQPSKWPAWARRRGIRL